MCDLTAKMCEAPWGVPVAWMVLVASVLNPLGPCPRGHVLQAGVFLRNWLMCVVSDGLLSWLRAVDTAALLLDFSNFTNRRCWLCLPCNWQYHCKQVSSAGWCHQLIHSLRRPAVCVSFPLELSVCKRHYCSVDERDKCDSVSEAGLFSRANRGSART